MNLKTNGFDLWIFHKRDHEPKYLLLHTSQAKAAKWFNGGRFWQTVPDSNVRANESLSEALGRVVGGLNLQLKGIWAAEHTYIIWNPRLHALELVSVFAAEVAEPKEIPLTWEHSEFGWFTASECEERLFFRGFKEGLKYVRGFVSEVSKPAEQLRII